ncbi:MAG: hypothetical protein ABIG28_00795 [archaeon]
MEKHIVRREFLKLKIKDTTYKECLKILEEKYGKRYGLRTLKYWWKRHNTTERDLKDKSQRPPNLPIKFLETDKEVVCSIRKKF